MSAGTVGGPLQAWSRVQPPAQLCVGSLPAHHQAWSALLKLRPACRRFLATNNAGAGFGESSWQGGAAIWSRPCRRCPKQLACLHCLPASATQPVFPLSPAVGDSDLVRISIMNYEGSDSSGEAQQWWRCQAAAEAAAHRWMAFDGSSRAAAAADPPCFPACMPLHWNSINRLHLIIAAAATWLFFRMPPRFWAPELCCAVRPRQEPVHPAARLCAAQVGGCVVSSACVVCVLVAVPKS